jgi:hypothetical protein
MLEIVKEVKEIVNVSTFYFGVAAGVAGVILLQIILGFIRSRWKALIVCSVVIASVSLAIIALK